MFYPFRDEYELKVRQPPSYASTLSKPGILVIRNNKCLVKPYNDLVNGAFLNYRVDISPSRDPFLQKENEDVENELCNIELNEQAEISYKGDNNQKDDNYSEIVSSQLLATLLSDSDINDKVRYLNLKQIQTFGFIYHWAKLHVKAKAGNTSK